MKNPIAATLFALLLAIAVNLYYFITGNELTTVVSRTLFADLILILSLVPIYQAIMVRNATTLQSFPEKVKSGMKPVVMYTFFIALFTCVLFYFFGEALVESKLSERGEDWLEKIEAGTGTQEQMHMDIEGAKQAFTMKLYLPIVLVTNLFVGFLSSILAAVLVKK